MGHALLLIMHNTHSIFTIKVKSIRSNIYSAVPNMYVIIQENIKSNKMKAISNK